MDVVAGGGRQGFGHIMLPSFFGVLLVSLSISDLDFEVNKRGCVPQKTVTNSLFSGKNRGKLNRMKYEKRNLQRKQNPVVAHPAGGPGADAGGILSAGGGGGSRPAESAAQPEQTVEAEAEETAVTGKRPVRGGGSPPVGRRKREGFDPSLTLKVKVGGTVKTMEPRGVPVGGSGGGDAGGL